MAADRFTVIVENDITVWHDDTGVSYHYPRRYRRLLQPGTMLLHYKGKLRDPAFRDRRLSEDPHYFGISVAGDSHEDPASTKGDLIVDIVGYRVFDEAVHYKDDAGGYRETIPANRLGNFWRDGVRSCTPESFRSILSAAGIAQLPVPTAAQPEELTSVVIEGGKKQIYTTVYERDPGNRRRAIEIHGTSCFACDANLGEVYGPAAAGFIHVHHRRPLHLAGPTPVDPAVDLVPLCPTCHAIVHLRGRLRTVNEVRSMLQKAPIELGD